MKKRISIIFALFVAFFATSMIDVNAIENSNLEIVFSKEDQGIVITGVDSNVVGIQLEFTLKEGSFTTNTYRRDDDKTSFMKIIDSKTASIYVATEVDLRIGNTIFVGLIDLDEDMIINDTAKLTLIDFILRKTSYSSVDVETVETPVVEDALYPDGNDVGVQEGVGDTASTENLPQPPVDEEEQSALKDWMDNITTYLQTDDGGIGLSVHIISLVLAFVCFIYTIVKVFKEK